MESKDLPNKFELLKEPQKDADKSAIVMLADQFEQNSTYNMKDLIARASTLCLGE